MKELSDEERELTARALNHYYDYPVATNRDDSRYKELAERLQRKEPGKAAAPAAQKRKGA